MSDITPELLEQIRMARKKPREEQETSFLNTRESLVPVAESPTTLESADFVYEGKNDAGIVIQRIPYKNNLMEGMMTSYDDRGSLLCEIPFIKGKKEGVGIFYINGIKASEIPFQNDLMHGIFKAYHATGGLSMEASYKESYMDGDLLAYDETGALLKKETYAMGVKNGVSQTFYPSGKIYEEITFENNIPVNQSTAYHENGKPMAIKYYKDGKLVLIELYDDTGKLQENKSLGEAING